jgi:hypothetical protein
MDNLKLQQLERKIIEMQKEIDSLKQSSTIPDSIIKSFEGVGFFKTLPMEQPPYDWYDNAGFIATTEAAALATRFLRVEGKGSTPTYWIPLYTFNEMI